MKLNISSFFRAPYATPSYNLYFKIQFIHLFINHLSQDDSSGPTNVTVQLYFKQIQKIQENDQIITLYCWLEEVRERVCESERVVAR